MEGSAYNPNFVGYPQSVILGPTGIDAIVPDVSNTLYEQFGDQFSNEFRLWTKLHGGMIATKNPNGGRLFEYDRMDRSISVGANNSTTGTTLQFNIAVGEIESLGGQFYVYPRQGDIIKDMTTNTQGRITIVNIVNATTVTITAVSTDGTTNWVTPTAGKKYAIIGNSNVENSDGPNARATYMTASPYKLQIMREAVSKTDLAAGAQLWPVKFESGAAITGWSSLAVTQLEFRTQKMVCTNMWLVDYTTAAGQPSTTNGIWAEVDAAGVGVNVAADDYVLHLQDLTDLLMQNSPKSPSYMVFVNQNLNWPIQQDIYTRFADANIVQVRSQQSRYLFGENATDGMYAMFDFQACTLGGMTYNFRLNKLSFDSNVMGLDADTNLFDNTAFFFPSQAGTDADGYIARNFMLRYYQIQGIPQVGDQKIYYLQTGGMAPVATNRIMNLTTDAYINYGVQSANLPQVGYFYKAVGS